MRLDTEFSQQTLFYLIKLRYNKINAASLIDWLKHGNPTFGKFLVRVLDAVDNVVHFPVGGLAALQQRCDGYSVNEHPVLRDGFLKKKQHI